MLVWTTFFFAVPATALSTDQITTLSAKKSWIACRTFVARDIFDVVAPLCWMVVGTPHNHGLNGATHFTHIINALFTAHSWLLKVAHYATDFFLVVPSSGMTIRTNDCFFGRLCTVSTEIIAALLTLPTRWEVITADTTNFNTPPFSIMCIITFLSRLFLTTEGTDISLTFCTFPATSIGLTNNTGLFVTAPHHFMLF
jgi:hypothetical protein